MSFLILNYFLLFVGTVSSNRLSKISTKRFYLYLSLLESCWESTTFSSYGGFVSFGLQVLKIRSHGNCWSQAINARASLELRW
ncbi:hypothetical protein AAHE18_09G208400 [Arachis hypogaea]